MRRRASRIKVRHQPLEFELDLAPLLAVMVKLVPVLLISSAFVQVMTIDSDLPGSLQKAIEQSENNQVAIRIVTDPKNNLQVIVSSPQGEQSKAVPPTKDGLIDFDATHQALLETKKTYPQVFHLSIHPDGHLNYQDLVRVMDQARKAKVKGIEFPYTDQETHETKTTPWMFPEVMIEPVGGTT
ncbi:MAG: biopolymer transporter ExbD [Bdellovibrio sp.]|nr:MAG: biopolymer transporter ExbD [Bdellovibrio sp.]